MPAHGVMFHHLHDGANHPAGQGSITADQLRDIIQEIGPRNILPAIEFHDRAASRRLAPNHVCLTFDDNLRCQLDIALPVLDEFNLTAFWFIYSSVLEGNLERLEIYRRFRDTCFHRIDDFYAAFFVWLHETPFGEKCERALTTFNPSTYLTEFAFYSDNDRRFRFIRDIVLGPERYTRVMDAMIEQSGFPVAAIARELWMNDDDVCGLHRAGHVVGLHSHTHPTRLAALPIDEQRYEYQSNHRHLTALLGEPPTAMSHPCNSYHDGTLSLLRDLNVKVGFRSNMSRADAGPLELPRVDHADMMATLKQRRAA